jgi:hypothetical protein
LTTISSWAHQEWERNCSSVSVTRYRDREEDDVVSSFS